MNIWSKQLCFVVGLGLAPLSMASAQSAYPTQPIRLMVGYSPGGSVDIVAREYAQLLGDALKQSVVVENRGGASGTVAAQAVARSAPMATRSTLSPRRPSPSHPPCRIFPSIR